MKSICLHPVYPSKSPIHGFFLRLPTWKNMVTHHPDVIGAWAKVADGKRAIIKTRIKCSHPFFWHQKLRIRNSRMKNGPLKLGLIRAPKWAWETINIYKYQTLWFWCLLPSIRLCMYNVHDDKKSMTHRSCRIPHRKFGEFSKENQPFGQRISFQMFQSSVTEKLSNCIRIYPLECLAPCYEYLIHNQNINNI